MTYPTTYHTRGTTYSSAGLYTLPAGTWPATANVYRQDSSLVQALDVNFEALALPDADGNTHSLSVLATATETALWPLAVASQTNLGIVGITNCFAQTGTNLGYSGSFAGGGANAASKSAGVWGGQANSVGGYTVVNAVSIGTITAGTRIRIAVNGVTGKAWIGKVGSAWPASGDPETDANPWISGIDSRVFLACSIYTGSGNTWRLHVDAGDFTGTVPTGFVPWGAP